MSYYTFTEAFTIASRNIESAVGVMADCKLKRLATVTDMNSAVQAATFMLSLSNGGIKRMMQEYNSLAVELSKCRRQLRAATKKPRYQHSTPKKVCACNEIFLEITLLNYSTTVT